MVIADTNTMAFFSMGFFRKIYLPLQLGLQGYQCSLFPSQKKARTSHLGFTTSQGFGDWGGLWRLPLSGQECILTLRTVMRDHFHTVRDRN